jgi:S1-C subfamily serine protease/rhodanese-related sulfurtransferase
VRALVAALVAVVLGAPVAAEETISLQEAILRGKPATVLVVAEVAADVTLDCGSGPRRVTPTPFRETGTGWFVDGDGFIVTNAHVVQPAHQPPAWVTSDLVRRAARTTCEDDAAAVAAALTARLTVTPSLFVLLSNGFRLPATVAKYSPPVSTQPGAMSGRDLALLQVEAAEMPAFRFADSRHARIGDPLHILGYPGVVLTHELLNSTAKVEASVTNGAVSGFKQDVQNQSVIQTDAPAAWGNSGGPAVNSRGDVVGVLTFVSLAPDAAGSLVQGFNFVIPGDAVREFLRGTPVHLDAVSPFNTHWHAGLRQLFAGDASAAATAFREANRLQPDFPDVRRMLAEADERMQNPPPRPWRWRLLGGAVAGVAAAGLAAAYARRARDRRLRVTPGEVVRLFERQPPPVLLDVREPVAFALSPFRVPGSIHVPAAELERGIAALGLAPEQPIVAYGTLEQERDSIAVARRLQRWGYRGARVLRGGLGGWTNAGLPLAVKTVSEADAQSAPSSAAYSR